MSNPFGEREDLGSILMRVIRTLSETGSVEDREDEKKKLEHKFRDSDTKVDQMVLQKQKELTQVMQTYARVSNRLTSARTRVRSVREGLQNCKTLLHYKRDELKKLWLDGVEHRHVLRLLEQIEELKESPEKISRLLAQKNYLEATKALVHSLNHLQGDLKNVDGLVEVKEILEAKKENIYRTLMEDLTRQLYVESTWEILQLKRHDNSFRDNAFRRSSSYRGSSTGPGNRSGSGRKENRSKSTPPRREDRGPNRRQAEQPPRSRRALLETATTNSNQLTQMRILTLAQEEEFQRILENPKVADQDGGPSHLIVIDIECLSMLNKLPDSVESLKAELLSELQNILIRTTQTLIEAGPYSQGDARLLPELFGAVVEQFYLVIDSYRLFALAIPKSVERHQSDSARIDLAEVWSRVQSVIQMLLTDYLDFKSKNVMHAQSSSTQFSEPTADMNTYFVRRKIQRPKRESLFRFEYSSTALSMNDYMKENNIDDPNNAANPGDKNNSSTTKTLVCPPNPHNITPIYSSLMEFIGVIEKALKCDVGNHCTLYAFLMDYIKDVFLGQIHADNADALNAADSWKAITDSDVLRELNVQRPLLHSTVVVKKSLDDLNRYMRTLPLYCEHFLTMICSQVMKYKEICLAAYRGVIQPDTEDKRIISAQWAKDDDIARFLRSLPNWQAVQSSEAEVESPQEVDQRNAKETAMLKGNLGESDIPSHEILYHAKQLSSLAQLQESLEWFAKNILTLSNDFRTSNASAVGDLPKLNDNSVQTLISLAREFEELADTCLLVLHLEVRVHCFHYLHPIWKGPAGAQFAGGQDSTDPNPEVVKLTKDLIQIEEALSQSIQEKKIRYIFEGVSHLVAAILISAAEHIRKINANGVKKMCRNIFALQQTLTSSITGSREMALDTAKQYYELCNLKPADILSGIVEKGPMFSKDEYAIIFRLLHRSDPNSTTQTLHTNEEKLGDIMSKAGVAV